MDNETREKFKKALDEMIRKATVKEETADKLQIMVVKKRADFENMSASGSTYRSRRRKVAAASLQDQVEMLEDELKRLREQIRELWMRIRAMQEEEKGLQRITIAADGFGWLSLWLNTTRADLGASNLLICQRFSGSHSPDVIDRVNKRFGVYRMKKL